MGPFPARPLVAAFFSSGLPCANDQNPLSVPSPAPGPALNSPVLGDAPPRPAPAPPPGLRPLRRPRSSALAQCRPRRARWRRPRLSHGVCRTGQLVEPGVPGRGRALPEHPGDLSGGLQAAAHLRRQHPEVQPGPSSPEGRRRAGPPALGPEAGRAGRRGLAKVVTAGSPAL